MYLPSAFSLLCCAVALINGDGVDDIIDEILYEGEQYLKDNHLEIVQIPDVNVTYDNVKLDGTVYNGFINGKNGKLQNTTTLRRIDDAKIDFIGDDQMILRLNVSFASLSVHYDVFNFKLCKYLLFKKKIFFYVYNFSGVHSVENLFFKSQR